MCCHCPQGSIRRGQYPACSALAAQRRGSGNKRLPHRRQWVNEGHDDCVMPGAAYAAWPATTSTSFAVPVKHRGTGMANDALLARVGCSLKGAAAACTAAAVGLSDLTQQGICRRPDADATSALDQARVLKTMPPPLATRPPRSTASCS
jgi:hypothetical protein